VTPDFDSHGIVGFSALADGGLVFTTSTGYLYRLTPGVAGENDLPIAADLNPPPDPPAPDTRQNGTASQLRLLGTVLPQGESYTACLFCPDGESLLCGLGRRRRVSDYTAFTYNLQSNQARLVPVGPETADALSKPKLLLYGCNTLDDQGNGYAVGRWRDEPGFRPIAFRVEWPEPVDD